jgi:hypothetical protein
MDLAEQVALAEDHPAGFRPTTLELEPTETTRSVPVVRPQAAVALAENSPAAIMMAALKQGIPLDQIEKMMDLQDRYERREAEKAYAAAFSAFKAETVEIIKRKEVDYPSKGGRTQYKHAELSDVLEAVTPHLSKHGLGISWNTTKQDRGWVEVTCTLRHTGGHSETVTLGAAPDDSGGKNAIQAVGSAITYLERYTAKAILGVAEKGQDDDGASTSARADRQTEGGDGRPDPLQTHRDAGQAAAMEGMAKLTAWWKTLNAKEQSALSKDFGEMRKCARRADGETSRV